jgi:type IV pilus assembly protein PilQ
MKNLLRIYFFAGHLVAVHLVATAQNVSLPAFPPQENIDLGNLAQGQSAPENSTNGLSKNDATLSSDGTAPSMATLVDLEYNKANLIDTLRLLAEISNVNIAFSAGVNAKSQEEITIKLKKISHENAMRIIMDVNNLAGIIQNGVLRIGTKEELESERDKLVKARALNWKLEPTRVLVYQVNYANATEVKAGLDGMMKAYTAGDNRFTVSADKDTNKLVIEGVADAISRAKAYIQVLDKRKPQVKIEARIVEASTDLTKTLGVSWGTRFALDAQRGLSTGLIFPNSIVGNIGGAGALGQAAPSLGGGGGSPSTNGSFGFTLGSMNGMINIDGILKAYETENLANIVASPQITVEDMQEAQIKEDQTMNRAGFGTTASSSAVNLNLRVRPKINPDNTIHLEVGISRATPSNAPTDLNSGSVNRSASTKLTVDNGETAVIGGLYQTLRYKSVGRIPILGKLPIIGFLFRNTDENTQRSELIVMITPRILPFKGDGGLSSELSPTSNFAKNNSANVKNNQSANPAATSNNLGSNAASNFPQNNVSSPNNSGSNGVSGNQSTPTNSAPTNNFGGGNEFGSVPTDLPSNSPNSAPVNDTSSNQGGNLPSDVPAGNSEPSQNTGSTNSQNGNSQNENGELNAEF